MAKIKREDGSCSEYKNAEFIPAFLMIPKELLIRCGMEMFMLPRTRAGLLHSKRQCSPDMPGCVIL